MLWFRMTFFAVIGKKAPLATVASFAITMKSRPAMRARPVTQPAAGALPSYIAWPAWMPSSRKSVSGSMSWPMRSRAVSRPFLCCAATRLSPPPLRVCFSAVRTSTSFSSTSWRLVL